MKKMSKYARDRLKFRNKPRKVLSLEERVQALRMFERTPVYQRVASAFGCSWEQIKNVVLTRKEILNYYARCQTIMPNDHPNQVRKKKIIFLGNVVFEYIRRAAYHRSAPLDDNTIRARALEFRDAIDIEQFYPNNIWLSDFKRVFNIELPNPDNIIVSQKPAESLDCRDIMAHCKDEIEKLLAKRSKQNSDVITTLTHPKTTVSDNDDEEDDDESAVEDEEGQTIDFSNYEYNDACSNGQQRSKENTQQLLDNAQPSTENTQRSKEKIITKKPSPTIVDTTLLKIKQEQCSRNPKTSTKNETSTIESRISSNSISHKLNTATELCIPTQVTSLKSALAHLIPLQDFALGEEDFFAINLLAKLEEHYRHEGMKRHIKEPQ